MAELGLTIAFSDHREEPEDELVIPAAHHVAGIAIGVFCDAPCNSETIFAFCHVIAKQVFMYQQWRVLSRKEIELGNQPSECSDEESFDLEESEESLYQVCGAQLHRMFQARCEKWKESSNKDKIQCEIKFLKYLTMNHDEKQIHLPSSLLNTERGGRTFPKRELPPFLQKIATDVKNEVNEANFKRYGETSL